MQQIVQQKNSRATKKFNNEPVHVYIHKHINDIAHGGLNQSAHFVHSLLHYLGIHLAQLDASCY